MKRRLEEDDEDSLTEENSSDSCLPLLCYLPRLHKRFRNSTRYYLPFGAETLWLFAIQRYLPEDLRLFIIRDLYLRLHRESRISDLSFLPQAALRCISNHIDPDWPQIEDNCISTYGDHRVFCRLYHIIEGFELEGIFGFHSLS